MYFNSGLEDLPDYLCKPNLLNKAHASREHFGLFSWFTIKSFKVSGFTRPKFQTKTLYLCILPFNCFSS